MIAETDDGRAVKFNMSSCESSANAFVRCYSGVQQNVTDPTTSESRILNTTFQDSDGKLAYVDYEPKECSTAATV